MEKVLVQFSLPGFTSKQYDRVWEELRGIGIGHPEGLIYHVGAQKGNDWIINEVWESEKAANEFGEILSLILDRNGISKDYKPEITKLHYEYSALLEYH